MTSFRRFVVPALAGLVLALPAQGQSTGDALISVKSATGALTPTWVTKTASRVIGWNSDGVLTAVTASGAEGSSAWGDITGTLSAQTDLQSALDAKVASSSLSESAVGGTVPVRTSLGALLAKSAVTVSALIGSQTGSLSSGGLTLFDGTYSLVIGRFALTGNRQIDFPNVSGDVITTGNLSSITSTGTIASGTWQGSVIDPAYLGTGTSITTKFLRGDGTWQTITGGGDALVANPLSQFAATTSAQLAGVISDETGSGALVFGTSPTLTTPSLGVATATSINGTTIPTSKTLVITDDIGSSVQAYDADLTTYAGITPSANVQTLLGSADYAAARSNLGLVIGTNVQAWDADLDDLADGTLTGSKVASATTSSVGVVELATDGETGGSVAVVGSDSRLAEAVTETYAISCSDLETEVTTGTSKGYFRPRHALTITSVRVYVLTAPTGSALQVDINEAGTSILSTVLSIDATEFDSSTAATPAVVSDSSIAAGALVSVDFDQVGATLGGTGVIVEITGTYTP